MTRYLDKDRIRMVINAVREKPMSWTELIRLGIPEKSLNRVLVEYLSYWGLVEKDSSTGLWTWFQHASAFRGIHDYNVALDHSKELLKGFHFIFMALGWPGFLREKPPGIKGEEIFLLKKAAEDHLRTGYPDVFQDSQEAMQEKENARAVLAKEIWGPLHSLKNLNWKDPRLVMLDDIYDYLPVVHLIPKNKKDVRKIIEKIPGEKLNTFREIGDRVTEIHLKSCSEIQEIIMRIDNGEPLKGSCSLCPRISINND